jgi:tetratricopeptide (TPR) repeat protein
MLSFVAREIIEKRADLH